MNTIDHFKKAQDLGLRVQFKNPHMSNVPWVSQKWKFDNGPECYRIHPEDEKAFANILELEALLADAVASRDEWVTSHSRVSQEVITLRIENERLKKASTTQDLIAQLRNQLGPGETLCIVLSGE